MKKTFLLLMLALTGLIQASTVPPVGFPGPYVSESGGVIRKNGLYLGTTPGSVVAMDVVPCTAGNAITVTWPVALSSVTVVAGSTNSPYLVTPTATLGDVTFYGIALNTAAAGETVYVARRGIVSVNVTPAVTKGDKLIVGGAVGTACRVTAVSEALFTGLSGTAIVGRCMESASAGSKVRVDIGR